MEGTMDYERFGLGIASLRLDGISIGQVNAEHTDAACARAEEIARRWNAHDDLVAALRKVVHRLSAHNPGGTTRFQGEALEEAYVLLSRLDAEGMAS